MNDLNVNSYDLSDAQVMLQALLPKQRGTSVENKPRVLPNRYIDLSSVNHPRRTPVGKTVIEEVQKESEEFDTAVQDFDSWEGILAWCMSLSRAETGFVVDSQGFVIASRGRIPSQGIEGIGAELVCSIEQLERIDPDAGKLSFVEMEFDKRRLAGFVACSDKNNEYVAGLIAPEPLNSVVKHKIIQQIIHNLPQID